MLSPSLIPIGVEAQGGSLMIVGLGEFRENSTPKVEVASHQGIYLNLIYKILRKQKRSLELAFRLHLLHELTWHVNP